MVYQIAALIIIPIILTIVTISPFEELIEEESIEQEPEETVPSEPQSNIQVVFFILLAIWFLVVIRILYQFKRGTFKLRNKF